MTMSQTFFDQGRFQEYRSIGGEVFRLGQIYSDREDAVETGRLWRRSPFNDVTDFFVVEEDGRHLLYVD